MDISDPLYHLSLTSGLFRIVLKDMVQVWTGEICKLANANFVIGTLHFCLFLLPLPLVYRDIGFIPTFV